MAYQNGQQQPYDHHPYDYNHPPSLRRMPSYNVGDDASLFARTTESLPTSSTVTTTSTSTSTDPRYAHLSMPSPSSASPQISRDRAFSQSSYQYNYTSAATTYRPQQYASPSTPSQPSLGYNPLAYSTLNTSTPHQPYNPAAYQPANVASPITPYAVPHPSLPPPPPPPSLPPRGPEHPYGARQSVTYGSSFNPMSPTATYASPTTHPHASTSISTLYPSTTTYAPVLSSEGIPDQPPEPPAHASLVEDPYAKIHSVPTPPMHQAQPQHSPRRTDTLTRHPQSRPLPGPPVQAEDVDGVGTPNGAVAGHPTPEPLGYEDLIKEVDAAVKDTQLSSASFRRHHRPLHVDTAGAAPDGPGGDGSMRLSPDERHTHTNGSIATGTGQYVNYDAYSDDSDAEAAAGLAMLQMADEEERAQAERLQGRSRRETNASLGPYGSYSSVHGPSPHPDNETTPYGASYRARHSSYDNADYDDRNGSDLGRLAPTSGSMRSSNMSADSRGDYSDDYEYPPFTTDPGYPFQDFTPHARVDAGGTGGLAEPGAYARRMSFDYGEEEAEESPSHPHSSPQSDSEGFEDMGEPGDLFFHPGMRPLPPAPVEPANSSLIPHLMPAGTYRHQEQADWQSPTQYTPSHLPVAADSPSPTVSSPSQVPRSTSLSSHPIGPRADPPIRSKTDADRAKHKQQQELLRQQEYGSIVDASPQADMTLDLPTIPAGRRKKFNPAKLSSEQFRRCEEPWALSAILAWIRELSEDETDLKEQAIVDAIVALFTHKVPTMNIADAETLAARVVKNMMEEEALVQDEEWVKFGRGRLSGVLFQITGTGCYSSRLHEQENEVFGRCYSHHCMRTLKKVNLKAQMMEPQKKAEDWMTFYKVSKELLESHPKKEIDRQNNLHEIVTTEDYFISQLDVLRELYRDRLGTMQPSVINPKRLTKFLHDVFGKVDAVKKVNEDHLLAQLKYRQKEQGPFIAGFSDIFREWIRKAKAVYVDYASTFPYANYLVRKESERNIHFRQFLNSVRELKQSNRLSWDTYLKSPITRIQRYTLLLTTVHKNMIKDSEEKTNLAQAIDEIKLVALECDNKVGEMSKKVDLVELSSKLQLRPDMKKEVELNLEHLGREIIFRGDLQRPGTRTRFLVDTHAILFDHYLVLAKTFTARDPSRTVKYESYDVSKLPIPMDLLVLESTNDDPVVKSSVRGVVATSVPQQAAARGGVPLNQANSGNSTNTTNASSGKTLVPTTVLDSSNDKVLYPFKIKHLGTNGTYTLYAFSAQNRRDWCEKIIEAKTKHANALFAQNAEPFRLRVLADTAFANTEHSPSKSVTIKGTPLDRAIKEVEQRYPAKSRPHPVCRSNVHCATVFQQPAGRMMCAVGTDNGVYVSEYNNPRGWARSIPISRVTQIAVFEEFNLFLLIADKSLIAYHLDVVCPASGVSSPSSTDSARRAPQKLSGAREVGFFAAGHMKDRTLVMYKKRDGLSSTFKVLEPVLQKSATSRSKFFSRRSQTEFFREYDEFYIPAESYCINMFHSSLAISTQRGVEILTLDKKQSWSVPDFRSETAPEAQARLSSIANRISDLRPLGMFRLSDSEFLVVYTNCAVYVNKHGDVSRSVVMEFVGRAHSACLYGKFLILFNDDFVEVRNAMNGRLRQVIPGHNVVCLDDGSSLPGSGANSVPTSAGGAVNLSSGLSNGVALANTGHTVKISMQHPQYERSQIVLELIENEGQKD
ncbi:CNH domain-containing protein [Aspergillus ambiguus]|uniref:putative Rho guanyl nucleotide exchange factor n=1 Tax=Aspergillus ambiguus TaxID=176160 RepID=UPI003CCE16D4